MKQVHSPDNNDNDNDSDNDNIQTRSGSPTSSTCSDYSLDVDSIYSMTPFVGGGGSPSSASASSTSVLMFPTKSKYCENITPQSIKEKAQFDFPPELLKASSSSTEEGPSASTTSVPSSSSQSLQQNASPLSFKPPTEASDKEPSSKTEKNENSDFITPGMKKTTGFFLMKNKKMGSSSRRMIRVQRSMNPSGADAVHPKKSIMKKQRKRRTAAGAVGGMVVGGLVLGPVGIVVGAAAGGVATNRLHKARERHVQRKYEKENFQKAANKSSVHQGAFA